jgi:hypothetical protein
MTPADASKATNEVDGNSKLELRGVKHHITDPPLKDKWYCYDNEKEAGTRKGETEFLERGEF